MKCLFCGKEIVDEKDVKYYTSTGEPPYCSLYCYEMHMGGGSTDLPFGSFKTEAYEDRLLDKAKEKDVEERYLRIKNEM